MVCNMIFIDIKKEQDKVGAPTATSDGSADRTKDIKKPKFKAYQENKL